MLEKVQGRGNHFQSGLCHQHQIQTSIIFLRFKFVCCCLPTLQSTCAVTSVKEEQLANFSLFLTKAMMSFPSTRRNCFLVPFSPEITNLNPSAQFCPLVRTWLCSTNYKCINTTGPRCYLAYINPLAPFPHICSPTGLPNSSG